MSLIAKVRNRSRETSLVTLSPDEAAQIAADLEQIQGYTRPISVLEIRQSMYAGTMKLFGKPVRVR